VYEHNAKNASGVPWVTSLIYRSIADPTAIYLAFEDLPMSPADWHQTGSLGSQYMNDGDFNDSVFFISGLGASKACPDPACANVVCDADETCVSGVCAPAGSVPGGGAAGAGGAGDGSTPGNELGGASSGPPPSAGMAGDSASANNTAGAADTPRDGVAGAPDMTTAGAPSGGHTGGAPATSKGCGCRVGTTRGQTPTVWLGLALALTGASALRRRSRRKLAS